MQRYFLWISGEFVIDPRDDTNADTHSLIAQYENILEKSEMWGPALRVNDEMSMSEIESFVNDRFKLTNFLNAYFKKDKPSES